MGFKSCGCFTGPFRGCVKGFLGLGALRVFGMRLGFFVFEVF